MALEFYIVLNYSLPMQFWDVLLMFQQLVDKLLYRSLLARHPDASLDYEAGDWN